MSPLRKAVGEYLTIRRSLGYQLYSHELLLNDFLAFLERAGADTVTIELAVRWARLPRDAKPIWWARRLGVVRGFAKYLASTDPRTEVPPRDLLPARAQRLAPYIYSPAETQALMAAAETLQPRLRGATHSTLIGLLAAYCNDQEKHIAFITSVSVLRAWTNHDIATRLVGQCVKYAKALGMRQISLDVAGNNMPAIKLYERSGFVSGKANAPFITMDLYLKSQEEHE